MHHQPPTSNHRRAGQTQKQPMKTTHSSSLIICRSVISHLKRAGLAAILILATSGIGRSQQPAETRKKNPDASPSNQSQTVESPGPAGQNPAPVPSVPIAPPVAQSANPLTLDETIRLALTQASSFQQARLAEQIAAEDARQARLAFLPRALSTFSHV